MSHSNVFVGRGRDPPSHKHGAPRARPRRRHSNMPAGGGKDFCVVELLVWWCASTLRAFPPASLSVRSAAYLFSRKHSARIAREPARARSTCTPKRDRRRAEGECVVSKAGGTVVRSASPRASAPSATTRRSSTSCCCGIYIYTPTSRSGSRLLAVSQSTGAAAGREGDACRGFALSGRAVGQLRRRRFRVIREHTWVRRKASAGTPLRSSP